jgi:hypothetical protein
MCNYSELGFVPGLVIAVLPIPKPRRFWVRCGVAVFVGWLFDVLFTLFVFNPSGMSASRAISQHFSEANYDNHTSGIAMAFGWLTPVLIAIVFAGIRFSWKSVHRNV